MEFAKNLDCFFDGGSDLGMEIVEEKCPRHADAQLGRGLSAIMLSNMLTDGDDEIRHSCINAGGIACVEACQHLQHQRRVIDRVCDRADVIVGRSEEHTSELQSPCNL